MNFDLAYIVSHGFASRMIMQTNLLGLLVKEGKKVALIAPDGKDENLKNYCDSNSVALYEFNPHFGFWTTQYLEARKYILDDLKENPALWEKHIYSIRYQKSRNPWNHIRPRLFILLNYFKNWFPGLRNFFKRRELKFVELKEADSLIVQLKPKMLVSTYPVHLSEAMLLKSAKKFGSGTVMHLLSWDNISCKGHFPQLADAYIAWGPIMKKELIQYYDVKPENIFVCGVPHFDLHIKSRKDPQPGPYLNQLGLDQNMPYLFFGMSSPRFAPKEIEIVEWLANEVRKDRFGKNMQLIIRPHPQNVQGNMADKTWLPRLKLIHGKRVGVDFPDLVQSKMPWSMHEADMKRLSQLLASCSVCLNSGSTLSIDALMCGVPVILTSFDAAHELEYWKSARRLISYRHLSQLVSLKGVSVVDSFEKMSLVISNYLSNPEYLIETRGQTISEQCSNFHNPATGKIIDAFLSFLDVKTRICERGMDTLG